jgi:hypothetical protein
MTINRRDILKAVAATGTLAMAPAFLRAQGLEKK